MGFSFKQFHIEQEHSAMKVGTDGVLLGAWAKGGLNILDIGTGTGLIALMMAQRFPNSKVVGIDIDENAIKDALYNVRNSSFIERVSIEQITLQTYGKKHANEFDAVVCNPPYFINSLKTLSESRTIARHTDSLSYAELVRYAKEILKDKGIFSVIIPAENVSILKAEAIFSGFQVNSIVNIFTKPSAKKAKRSLLCFQKTGEKVAINEQSVILNEADGKRTTWYQELTANFYIK